MESDLDYKQIFPRVLNESDAICDFTNFHYPNARWKMDIKVNHYFALGELFIALYRIEKEILDMD